MSRFGSRPYPKFLIILAFFILQGSALMTGCQSSPFQQGEILYENFCANCHMKDGTGLEGNIPPLARADYLAKNPDKLACIIRYGLSDTIKVNGRTYQQPMAGIPQLTYVEITNIINYIHQAWGNELGYYPNSKTTEALENCTK